MKQIISSPKSRTRLLAGILVVLVVVIAFMGYYMLQLPTTPEGEETPITTASEAGERISVLQEQLQGMADELKTISEEL